MLLLRLCHIIPVRLAATVSPWQCGLCLLLLLVLLCCQGWVRADGRLRARVLTMPLRRLQRLLRCHCSCKWALQSRTLL